MFTTSRFTLDTPSLHMGRDKTAPRDFYVNRLGVIPATYNGVLIPRPTIWDTDFPDILPTADRIGTILH